MAGNTPSISETHLATSVARLQFGLNRLSLRFLDRHDRKRTLRDFHMTFKWSGGGGGGVTPLLY